MLCKTARCRDPLRSVSLRYTTLVPLKEGQYSFIGFIAERLTRKHCPHFKGDERREALGERSGSRDYNYYIISNKFAFSLGLHYL